jgi:hypothetical protein
VRLQTPRLAATFRASGIAIGAPFARERSNSPRPAIESPSPQVADFAISLGQLPNRRLDCIMAALKQVGIDGDHRLDSMACDPGQGRHRDSSRSQEGDVGVAQLMGGWVEAGRDLGWFPDVAVEVALDKELAAGGWGRLDSTRSPSWARSGS